MSLPHYLTHEHIRKGMEYIDQNGVPSKRKAYKFELRSNGRKYPPKYVICVAHISYDRQVYPWNVFGGGDETNNFLISRGFEVWNKIKGERVGIEPIEENETKTFEEGSSLYALHRKLERDSAVAKLAKKRRLSEKGELTCDVCGFSFQEVYGSVGSGYIEAHHTVPVSEMAKRGKKKTHMAEIALVCSNCHRMIHRYRPWLTIAELSKVLSKSSQA